MDDKAHTILVVDDQEGGLALISRYLGDEGFKTIVATAPA